MMFFGIMIGTAFCAFYIAVVGVPIAALLRDNIEKPTAAWISVAAATLTAIAASYLMAGGGFSLQEAESQYWLAALLCYAIPAGLLYRQSVVAARQLSQWAS